MAAFETTIQPASTYAQPNFDRLAGQPITQPLADTSTGEFLKTAGIGIEGATQLADQTVKKVIDTDVDNTVDPIRQDFTNQLESVRQAQTGLIPGATAASGQPQPSVPDAVNSALGKVDSLQAALSNGKINDTYYYGRLSAAVTDLRAKYPGYRDYIDAKVAQTTGVNPANAYMTNLMQDINRMQTSKKSDLDRAVDDAVKSGYPGAQDQVRMLETQGSAYLPQFRDWYTQQTQLDSMLKRKNAIRQDTQGDIADIKQQRTSDFTNEVGSAIQSNFNSIQTIAGLSTPSSILKVVADAAANPGKYTDAQMQALATKLSAQKALLQTQMLARAQQMSKDSQGRPYSYSSDIGAENATNIVKTTIDAAYDPIIKAITDKDVGTAFVAMNHARALLDQSKDNLLSDSNLGGWAAKMANFNQLFGPNWTSLTTTEGLKANIDDKMRAYLESKILDARLQPDFNKDGTPTTLKQHMDEALALQKQGKITSAMRGRYVNNLLNITNDITDKEAPIQDKINVMRYLFSPEGQGILNGIKTDTTDPVTGKFIPGKYSVFTRLTSNDIVREVAKMPSDIQTMYKNYMEREAGSELFYKEMQNLNHFTEVNDIHFAYNDGGNGGVPHISLITSDNKPLHPISGTTTALPDQGYTYQVQKIVDRVNDALAGMSRVEKGFGGNASEYALSFLIKSQVHLGKNWEGLPARLMDSMAATLGTRKLHDFMKANGQ